MEVHDEKQRYVGPGEGRVVSLESRAAAVSSREDLVAFLRELARDHEARPAGWENASLQRYLEAMAAWTEDMEGYYESRGEPAPVLASWRRFAEILLAARLYE